ncbi:hypothetical protein CASFOL_010194 [Castilleja foliolosa]|uniref:F-box protein n=1 Tax=Castilleja foliolosa TaxID=1961234 RepID=A0ABD3DT02_9LAMI
MAGGGEIQFPKAVIQRLQSFLTGKEAARTAVVSKSWHSAWLTHPNLDLDDSHFKSSHNNQDDDFKKYAKKTIKRYEESSIKIESFNLCMKIEQYGRADLANKLIVKALRIGVTRLCLRLNNNRSFDLPNEVFGADNLVELSVSGCTIKLDDRVVIKYRSLESLSLDGVYGITMDKVSNMVSSCPCIEKLSILPDYYDEDEYCVWDIDAYLGVKKRRRRVNVAAARKAAATAMAVGVVDNLIPRLRCLMLGYESFKALCLGDLLHRFPFLKDFTLYIYNKRSSRFDAVFEEGIQISSCSLERIKLVLQGFQGDDEGRKPRVKFDVPSVRKFTFESDVIPCLSFMSTHPSREWESHLSIQCNPNGFFAFWFNELSELLTELSQSKTHLFLNAGRSTSPYFHNSSFDYKVGDKIIQGLRKHELENLTIDMMDLPSLSCYALFDGLFRLCRPKLITQHYKDDPDKQRYDYDSDDSDDDMDQTNIEFLCQTLDEGKNFKVSRPTQFMYGLNDLEEVNVQAFDMDSVPAEWKPIPFESLLDKHVQVNQRIRLLLKWKPS